MAVPYTLSLPYTALPEILSGTTPAVEITGLASLPAAAAIGVGAWGYNRYQENMKRLNEKAHYSDRNANRLIRNIGQPSRKGSVVIPEGYLGSQSNPVQLGEIVFTPRQSSTKVRSFANQAAPTDSVGATPANPSVPADSVSSTTSPTPEPERNDSTGQEGPSFRERIGNWIAGRNSKRAAGSRNNPTSEPKLSRGLVPFTGYNNGTWLGNLLRGARDWQTVGTTLDAVDTAAGKIGERLDTTRVNNSNWNFTRDYTPSGLLFHLSTKERPAASVDTTKTSHSTPQNTDTFVKPITSPADTTNTKYRF